MGLCWTIRLYSIILHHRRAADEGIAAFAVKAVKQNISFSLGTDNSLQAEVAIRPSHALALGAEIVRSGHFYSLITLNKGENQ
jgi:hypothetical protein